MKDRIEPANRQIARATGVVMAAFVLSQLTGLIYQILAADAFGTNASMEAFNAANRVAETLFNLVAGGALASAFIPVFTGLLTKGDHEKAWKLASSIFNLVMIILIGLSVLAALFAPQIVHYFLAPGFSNDPSKEALTIDLVRLMIPSAVIFGVSGLVMGILNSHQIFLFPALAPSMYRLGMIFGTLVLSPRMGIYGLAWGVVIGAALHLSLQLPVLFWQRHRKYFLTLGLSIPEVREVFRLMGPRFLGVAVVQLNFWVNTRIASHQPEGSVTGIVYAFTLMLMPQAAIAQSIATAAMPTLSAQFAMGKIKELRNSLSASLRGVLLLSIPASLGLIILREPLVALLLQRGEFTSHSTKLVAWALLWYAAGLVGHSVLEVLARSFYAIHDTKTPVFVGAGAMSLNVIFSFLFSAWFERIGWLPHGGLALANTVATAFEATLLYILMRKRLEGIRGKRVLDSLVKALIGGVLMGAALYGWLHLAGNRSLWVVGGGGVLVGTAVYLLSMVILRVDETREMYAFIKSKLTNAR